MVCYFLAHLLPPRWPPSPSLHLGRLFLSLFSPLGGYPTWRVHQFDLTQYPVLEMLHRATRRSLGKVSLSCHTHLGKGLNYTICFNCTMKDGGWREMAPHVALVPVSERGFDPDGTQTHMGHPRSHSPTWMPLGWWVHLPKQPDPLLWKPGPCSRSSLFSKLINSNFLPQVPQQCLFF